MTTKNRGDVSPFHLTVWNGLTTVQQRVPTAAVKENGTALASQAVTDRYGVSASTMKQGWDGLSQLEAHFAVVSSRGDQN
jgi:hypothetical protein